MKKIFYILLTFSLILVVLASCRGAIPTPGQGQKTFGGSDGDWGNAVQETSDGGYVITGVTESFGAGGKDVYLIKTDSGGNKEWESTFGGSNDEVGNSVQEVSDGGYIITGTTTSFGAGEQDVYLIKTDSGGNKEWEGTFGGSYNDWGNSVQETSDGGYIIAGLTFSFGAGEGDVYLIKTDSGGSKEWESTFGGSYYDWAWLAQETSDGGYVIAGRTESFGAGEGDVYLIKTDSGGSKEWESTFGGSDDDWGIAVQETSDGGYVIAGGTESFGDVEGDVYLIKTDSGGSKEWESTFGGSYYDWAWSAQETSDGGYIIVGETTSFGAGKSDVYLIKTDSGGSKEWESTFGGSNDDLAWSIQETSDSGYIIVGETMSFGAGNRDVYLIKTDSQGKTGNLD